MAQLDRPGVLLLNLGSPASTAVADVRAYLKEFLLDERVIDAPAPIRNLVVRGMILPFRPKKSAEAYEEVWTEEGSPLIVTSRRQQALLAADRDFTIELAMRYGSPSTPEAIRSLSERGVTQLLIIPLYPQYAMSSYETAVVHAMDALRKYAPQIRPSIVQPFYNDPDYIDALVQSAAPYLEKNFDRLLFSFHGIPERHLRKSDCSHSHCLSRPDCCEIAHPAHATCYRHQCFTTAHAFAERAGLERSQYEISFQSRLGRDPWLKPYTDYRLEELPKEGVKKLLVISPAFVSDCLETLEEISMQGRDSFLQAGGEFFEQIPCLNDHPAWIGWLASRIDHWLQNASPPRS